MGYRLRHHSRMIDTLMDQNEKCPVCVRPLNEDSVSIDHGYTYCRNCNSMTGHRFETPWPWDPVAGTGRTTSAAIPNIMAMKPIIRPRPTAPPRIEQNTPVTFGGAIVWR